MRRALLLLIASALPLFAQNEAVTIKAKDKTVVNPLVIFPSGKTLECDDCTLIGFGAAVDLNFIGSLSKSGTNVSLVNDSATPGNSKYYGTDSGGTKGFFSITSGVPGGTNTQLQYNNASAFGGISILTFDGLTVSQKADAGYQLYDPADTTKRTQFNLSNITTGQVRTVTIADTSSVTVAPDTGAANNFLTAIGSTGVVSKAQPAFSNLSGSATDAQVPDILTLTSIKDSNGDTILSFDPAASSVNNFQITNASNGTPTLNLGAVGTSTDINIRLASKNTGLVSLHNGLGDLSLLGNGNATVDNALTVGLSGSTNTALAIKGLDPTNQTATFSVANVTVNRTVNLSGGGNSTTVIPDTGSSDNFLTAISADGAISKAQPDFTNLSGDFALTQTPSLAADKLVGRGNGAGAGDWQAITLGTNLSMSGTTLNATGGASTIGVTIDGGGGIVTTGTKGYFTIHNAATITGWSIVASGPNPTCTIDVWKIGTGTALPTVTNTITASAKPALATGNAIKSSTLTGWTTSVSNGDIFGFNVDAVSNATRITFELEVTK